MIQEYKQVNSVGTRQLSQRFNQVAGGFGVENGLLSHQMIGVVIIIDISHVAH